MVSFRSGRMGSLFRSQQNLSHFLIHGLYCLTVCGRQPFVSMSADCSEIFKLRCFRRTIDRKGDLTFSKLDELPNLDEIVGFL